MKNRWLIWRLLWSGALLAMIGVSAALAADNSLDSVVRFNTTCAKCHEGECSGRLSFDLGRQASENHIRRYAGGVSPTTVSELRALLVYMKENCAYYPVPLDLPADKRWPAQILARLRSTAENTYFIPLGELAATRHRALLSFNGSAEACAQVISASFDSIDYPGIRADNGTADFVFTVERKGTYFLRLQTGERAVLVGLEIVPER